MIRRIQMGFVVATSLLGAMGGMAAESAGDAARRCAQVLGERERLACFDRAFPAGPETAALAESRAAAAPVPAPAPAAAVVAPAAAASVVPAAPAAAASTLGDEYLRKPAGKEESAAAKSLTARVTSLKETRQDVWRFNLDNGQVWQQMDMSETFHPSVGDTVEIQRKMMGGYSLALSGSKSSRWVRVTRLE